VTERLIWTLKREWLARVPLIRGLDHLGELLADFDVYYNQCRCHRRLDGATTGPIRLRHFREQRITVYELAA